MSPRVMQVIQSDEPRGEGKDASDPCRIVTRYYTLAGDFLAERDTWQEGRMGEVEG